MKLLCTCGKELVARRHQNETDIVIEPCWECRKAAFGSGQEDGERFERQSNLAHMRGQEMGL
jgi:hypothetical protein